MHLTACLRSICLLGLRKEAILMLGRHLLSKRRETSAMYPAREFAANTSKKTALIICMLMLLVLKTCK